MAAYTHGHVDTSTYRHSNLVTGTPPNSWARPWSFYADPFARSRTGTYVDSYAYPCPHDHPDSRADAHDNSYHDLDSRGDAVCAHAATSSHTYTHTDPFAHIRVGASFLPHADFHSHTLMASDPSSYTDAAFFTYSHLYSTFTDAATYAHAHPYSTFTDATSYAYTHPYPSSADAATYAHAHPYSSSADAAFFAHVHPYLHSSSADAASTSPSHPSAHPHTYAHTFTHTHAHTTSHAHTNTLPHAHPVAHAHPVSYSDTVPHATSNADPPLHTNLHAHPAPPYPSPKAVRGGSSRFWGFNGGKGIVGIVYGRVYNGEADLDLDTRRGRT